MSFGKSPGELKKISSFWVHLSQGKVSTNIHYNISTYSCRVQLENTSNCINFISASGDYYNKPRADPSKVNK